MKKVATIIIALITICILVACNPIGSKLKLEEKVSYFETHLYTGESGNFAVNITRGQKEDIFIADGSVGNLKNFSVLKVTPLSMDLFNKQYCYKVIGTSGELTGDLAKDMFGVSFSKEIENIDSIGDLMSVTITSTTINEVIELNNRLKDMISWEDVLEIAGTEFKDKIATEVDAEVFNREIHIKFINNRTDRNSPYYWYIALVASKTDYWALLLDPETGEIISKKS